MMPTVAATNSFETPRMQVGSFEEATDFPRSDEWLYFSEQYHIRQSMSAKPETDIWLQIRVTTDPAAERSTAIIQPTARWLAYVERRMQELAVNEDDPHGYPARDQHVIQRAWECAAKWFTQSTPAPSVVPTAEGGIEFVWHKCGWDLELAIDPDETWVWARERESGEIWHGSLDERRENLLSLLGHLGTCR
jgi:hypothetical protein